jgi:hypothetical protein
MGFILEDVDDAHYDTRRDWTLVECVIGIVSCATGLSGIADGVIGAALRPTATNMPWFLSFYFTGGGLILLAVASSLCRRVDCSSMLRRRLARTRMYLHGGNGLCWLTAFVWLAATETYVASVLYESLPLMAFNVWGAVEHAKALWLKPGQARTCSMAGAILSRLSRG